MTCPYYQNLCVRRDTPACIIDAACKGEVQDRCYIFSELEKRVQLYELSKIKPKVVESKV